MMFANLTRFSIALLALSSTACFINADDDDDNNDTNADSDDGTDEGTTEDEGTDDDSLDDSTGNADTGTGDTGAEDTGTGDTGSGDESGTAVGCGWGPTGVADPAEAYLCGGEGEDPSGVNARDCPAEVELVEGGDCGAINGIGCCDAEGQNWFCGMTEGGDPSLVLDPCTG